MPLYKEMSLTYSLQTCNHRNKVKIKFECYISTVGLLPKRKALQQASSPEKSTHFIVPEVSYLEHFDALVLRQLLSVHICRLLSQIHHG